MRCCASGRPGSSPPAQLGRAASITRLRARARRDPTSASRNASQVASSRSGSVATASYGPGGSSRAAARADRRREALGVGRAAQAGDERDAVAVVGGAVQALGDDAAGRRARRAWPTSRAGTGRACAPGPGGSLRAQLGLELARADRAVGGQAVVAAEERGHSRRFTLAARPSRVPHATARGSPSAGACARRPAARGAARRARRRPAAPRASPSSRTRRPGSGACRRRTGGTRSGSGDSPLRKRSGRNAVGSG